MIKLFNFRNRVKLPLVLLSLTAICTLTSCDNEKITVTSTTTATAEVTTTTTTTITTTSTTTAATTTVSETTTTPKTEKTTVTTELPEVLKWEVGSFMAVTEKGDDIITLIVVKKDDGSYYLEAHSKINGFLNSEDLSSPYVSENGFVLDEERMKELFVICEGFDDEVIIGFITGDDEIIRFFTIYCCDESGVHELEVDGSSGINFIEAEPFSELTTDGDKLLVNGVPVWEYSDGGFKTVK